MAKEPKGLEKRLFSTVPTKALFNTSLTALEWRVLGIISLHDGRSLAREAQGKSPGAGCIASNLTLAREAQCSYAALVRAVSKLEHEGLIQRQDRRGGNALAAIRVRFDTPDNVPTGEIEYDEAVTLSGDQNDDPIILEGSQYDEAVTLGGSHYDEIAHFEAPRAAENSAEQPHDYSPLRGELDVAEAMELDSLKGRDLKIAKMKSAKAGLGRESVWALMSPTFDRLDAPAQVAQIERAWAKLDRDSRRIKPTDRAEMISRLWAIHDDFPDHDFGQQAWRLCEEIGT